MTISDIYHSDIDHSDISRPIRATCQALVIGKLPDPGDDAVMKVVGLIEKAFKAGRCKLDPGLKAPPGFNSSQPNEENRALNCALNLNLVFSELVPLRR